jgi:hypothetical protein
MEHREKVDRQTTLRRITEVLREIPEAEISYREFDEFGSIAFQIEAPSGSGSLLVCWERLEGHCDETIALLRDFLDRLAPDQSWMMLSDGSFEAVE